MQTRSNAVTTFATDCYAAPHNWSGVYAAMWLKSRSVDSMTSWWLMQS